MHGVLCLRPLFTCYLGHGQPAGTVTKLRTLVITTSTPTIPVSECRQTQTPLFSGHSTTSPSSASPTPSRVIRPRVSTPSPPAFAIVAVTVSAALLFFGATCLLFAYRRKVAKRRNAARTYPMRYRTVAAVRPNSSLAPSSLSAQALLDPSLFAGEDGGNIHSLQKRQPHQNQVQTTKVHDRRSVDTIFALRFYYSQELDRRSKGSFLPELSATPALLRAPSTATPTERRASSRKGKPSQGRKAYTNPAGEPWVSVPPPAVPPPPPPAPETEASRPRSSSQSSPHSRPRFSLFPPPPKPPPETEAPCPRPESQSRRGSEPGPRPAAERELEPSRAYQHPSQPFCKSRSLTRVRGVGAQIRRGVPSRGRRRQAGRRRAGGRYRCRCRCRFRRRWDSLPRAWVSGQV
ncbi:hypothetical protein VTK56DRAFT_7140 [Thermocarpiscus australiensis]